MHRLFIPSAHNDYRPHLLRREGLLFFLALVLCTEGYLVGHMISPVVSLTGAVVHSDLIRLTNEARTEEARVPLQENDMLNLAAARKAQDMAARGYFSHVGPEGELPWEWVSEVGYEYRYAGENLAVRFEESEDVVEAWMASPTHRQNILKPVYTDIGIGKAEGEYEGMSAVYVVQYFATPLGGPAEVVREDLPIAAAVAESQTFTGTIEKFFSRIFTDPQMTSNTALTVIAGLLVIGLLAAFFIHLQIQHSRMLMGGAAMTLFVIGLMVANQQYFVSSSQSAAVGVFESDVHIGEQAYWIELE